MGEFDARAPVLPGPTTDRGRSGTGAGHRAQVVDFKSAFDKTVQVSEGLEQNLGDEVLSLRIIANPQRGAITTNGQSPNGDLAYSPEITDTRACRAGRDRI